MFPSTSTLPTRKGPFLSPSLKVQLSCSRVHSNERAAVSTSFFFSSSSSSSSHMSPPLLRSAQTGLTSRQEEFNGEGPPDLRQKPALSQSRSSTLRCRRACKCSTAGSLSGLRIVSCKASQMHRLILNPYRCVCVHCKAPVQVTGVL